MSKDIRSFFISKKVPKPKEDDDDVILESPDVQIKNKKKETRKRRVIQDDSDEEIFPSKKKASSSEKNKLSSKKKLKSPQNNTLREVKPVDLFGGPIQRTEPLVTKAKKKKTEVGIHSDDEFDKSLLELDITSDVDNCVNKNEDCNINNDKNGKTASEETSFKECRLKGSPVKENKETHKSKKIDTDETKNNNQNKKIKKEILHDDPNKETELNKCMDNDNQHNTHKKNSEVENDKHDHKKIKTEVSKDEPDRKRDFSEFIGNDSQVHEPKNKRRKQNTSLNESVLTDEERHERRLQSAALYQRYLNRSGPKHLGSKEIPEGSPDCLKNCAFLLTGVLDSFERDEIAEVIKKYGGCIKNSISKKVTHVLAGEDAGPAKLAKAQDLGIKIINEDEFLKMIKPSSEKTRNHNLEIKEETKHHKKSTGTKDSTKDENVKNSNNKRVLSSDRGSVKDANTSKDKITDIDVKEKTVVKDKDSEKKTSKNFTKTETKGKSESQLKTIKKEKVDSENNIVKGQQLSPIKSDLSCSLMWVDKYKPQNVKQIIGQHGDASNVKKLSNWLTKWYINRKAKLARPNPWAKNDDGGYYKAALLSGPPGVGKTTTVSLVCMELGFDAVEFNASDTRSKTLIKQQIGELLTTTSLSAYAKGDTGKQAVTKKHVLVMDEVDGMAGNEDRGGLQELIALIKTTSVPIICMCNDRNSPKMRSLVNYCYDLRFSRPRVDQIKSAMMSICFKEGVKISPETLSQLIAAAGQDVRQTLHALAVWAADAHCGRDARQGRKDVKMGPWEAIRKVFSAEDHKTMSLNDKSDLFFCDYSLAPLFVQENYLSVVPHCNKNEVLDRISQAADSISFGDVIDARIRGSQAWNLLPLQAMYSSVIPGHHLSGHVAGQIQFPGWLGKNSRANKMHRLCQEIHAHTRLSTSGSKSSIFLDYATHLRDAVLTPLIKDRTEGISKSLEVLESYHLLREDLDSLMELSMWPGRRDPNALVDAKVKAAMTRTYNKHASALPYAPGAVRKGRARDDHDDDDDELQGDNDDQDNEDPENDALIKKKTNKSAEKAGSSKGKVGSSKEKAGSSKEKAGTSKEKKKKK